MLNSISKLHTKNLWKRIMETLIVQVAAQQSVFMWPNAKGKVAMTALFWVSHVLGRQKNSFNDREDITDIQLLSAITRKCKSQVKPLRNVI